MIASPPRRLRRNEPSFAFQTVAEIAFAPSLRLELQPVSSFERLQLSSMSRALRGEFALETFAPIRLQSNAFSLARDHPRR